MTVAEAIEWFKDFIELYEICRDPRHGDSGYVNTTIQKKDVDAFSMAIRSLEAWKKVRTEIEENRDDWIKGQDPEWHTYDRCIAIINKHLAEVTRNDA